MRKKILEIWPEINWIVDINLREKVIDCWVYAIENSALSIRDLETMPFSLLLKDCKISFINHKRTAVQLSFEIAKIMKNNFGNEIEINFDILTAGAILIDIGKLIEYDKIEGRLTTSKSGKLIRHPFSGLAIADRFKLPAEVQHIIATHSKEGDLGLRTIESIIVHHADFVSFDPFKK